MGPLGVIGVGEIADAIVTGLCSEPDSGPEGAAAPDILLSPRGAARSGRLARHFPRVRVCRDNRQVADAADLVLLTVRPTSVREALEGVRLRPGSILVSALAGVSHQALQRLLGDEVTVIRAIPLPSVRDRSCLTATLPAHPAVTALFDRLGGTLEMSDSEAFSAFSAATAAMSTYLSFLASIAQWTTQHRVDPADANAYVRSMILGVNKRLSDPAISLNDLAAAHETRGGLNEQLRTAWLDSTSIAALGNSLDTLYQRVTTSAHLDPHESE